MFDMTSYVLGQQMGRGGVVLDGDAYTISDPGTDGNIVITESLGQQMGRGDVVLDGDAYTVSDPGTDGNIVITESE